MRSGTDKLFMKLRGRWLLSYVLEVMQASSLISEVIIAARQPNIIRITEYAKRSAFTKVRAVVRGGPTRSESVFNALCEAGPDSDYILIHDVARPLVESTLIRDTINAAKRYGASISAVPVKPTIKEAGPKKLFVKKTLDRNLLWAAQTPQVFKRQLLVDGYRKMGPRARLATDEASLIEGLGRQVKIVEGDDSNIKITTPEDLCAAESIIGLRKK